ncbi:Protein ANTI-SILENCING 1 [Linum grandiflorum]
MGEIDEQGCNEIRWTSERRLGGKNKDISFYDSFVYEGEEYRLYDSVYVYTKDEDEPEIGKLLKAWETANGEKKARILWFFRPRDIANYFQGENDVNNELFLAAGEGKGLVNNNPLEAIAGKCNVICTSRDIRNPQPSKEQIIGADFVFSRCFDVGRCKILEKMDEKIGGIEVKFLFNREGREAPCGVLKSGSKRKEIVDLDRRSIGSSLRENPASTLGLSVDHMEADHTTKLGEKGRNPAFASTGNAKRSTSPPRTMENSKIAKDVHARKEALKQKESTVENSRSAKDVQGRREGLQQNELSRNSCYTSNAKRPISPTTTNILDIAKDVQRSEEGPKKQKLDVELGRPDKGPKRQKLDVELGRPDSAKLPKPSQVHPCDASKRIDNRVSEMPVIDKTKWFKAPLWEEDLQAGYEDGSLVLLLNLNPSYTSVEVQELIKDSCMETCTAKMVQRTAFSNPHSGKALVKFMSKEAAERVISKLAEGCLLLPGGRCVMGRIMTSGFKGKQSPFYGHFGIDRLTHKLQRDKKTAVSTSHCSQPNTIEYEMALEWCLLQTKMQKSWESVHKQHGDDVKKLKDRLTSTLKIK